MSAPDPGAPEDQELRERLRLQEELLREAGELAHVGGWEFDPATGAGTWTAEVARIHDLDPTDPTSVSIGLSHYLGDSRARIEAAVAAASERGAPYDLELELVTHAGRRKWVRTIGRPEVIDGRVVRVRGSMQDITERVLAERRLELRDAVSQVLAEADSLEEAAPRLLAAIGACEGWQAGAIWQPTSSGRLACSATWHAPGVEAAALLEQTRTLTFRPGDGLPGGVWLRDAPEQIDVARAADFRRSRAATAAGMTHALGIPLRSRDEARGVLEFFYHDGYGLEPRLVETLRAIGAQIGQFIERRGALDALQRFVAASPSVIYALAVRPDGLQPIWRGAGLEQLTGWSEAEALDRSWWLDNVHPDDRPGVPLSHPFEGAGDRQVSEYRFRRKDGTWIWLRDEERLLRDQGGHPREIVGSLTDVTVRVDLEAKLRKAYKLEAIGRLAGGVAHDFNNLLTIVGGSAELLADFVPPEGRARELVDEIRETVEQGAALTRQLLAFGRRQELVPEPLDLAALVTRTLGTMRRLIGEDVEVELAGGGSPLPVRADRSQLEQVVLNLVVNARDAMPRGGRLRVELSEAELGAPAVAAVPEVFPGRFARLSVSDTGHGMSPEVRARIFEPFFTTKPAGRGTGLGLATVFGVVRQSGGFLEVESEIDRGTRFDVYLPLLAGRSESGATSDAAPGPRGGSETILIAEDDPVILRLTERALAALGYRILVAHGGEEALRVAEAHGGSIDLLISDLVMPRIGGVEVARALLSRQPRLRVVFMSGYAEIPGDALGRTAPIHLVKPFALSELGRVVREALDSPRREPGG